MELTQTTRILPVKLTEAEVALSANEMARAVEERDEMIDGVDQIKEEAKAEVKNLDNQITRADAIISDLAYQVRTNTQKREIECVWNRNDESSHMELVRKDDGDIIETRPMTAQEKQKGLFGKTGEETQPS